MIGAMSISGLRGFMTVDAATSGDVFVAYVEEELAPNLRPGDCVVMDNLAAHKNQRARRAIEERGASVLFLPPYSPDFNPIEKLWAKLKEFVRRCETLTRETFDDAVAGALKNISVADMRAWTAHCGYSLNDN
jgi:transposase